MTLIDISTLKPLDKDAVEKALRTCGRAVAVEDHNIYGALSGAIYGTACERFPCQINRSG